MGGALTKKLRLATTVAALLCLATAGLHQRTAHAVAGVVPAGQNQGLYPALQRPPADPAVVQRGAALYGINCRACHGIDLRGGDLGGPNLLRSQLVLGDLAGEAMWPVIRDGQSSPGGGNMPAQPLSEDDGRAVAVYIHSILATASRQGGPPLGEAVELDILVGDPSAGQAYFNANCASCHSASGDLNGIAMRIPDPKELQNTWVRGRARGGPRSPVTVTVTVPTGERVAGHLERLDDFIVVLTTAAGEHRSFTRRGGVPRVDVDDPMARHTELLTLYADSDIHNVTAYLATLK